MEGYYRVPGREKGELTVACSDAFLDLTDRMPDLILKSEGKLTSISGATTNIFSIFGAADLGRWTVALAIVAFRPPGYFGP